MLKNFRLIALVFCVALFSFEAIGQSEGYKEVLLNGKPARLNLQTGEVTYVDGEIAKTRAARKLKDSFLSTQTEIKTNLIVDMPSDTAESDEGIDSKPSTVSITEITDPTHMSSEDALKDTKPDHSGKAVVIDTGSGSGDVLIHEVVKGETLYGISNQYNLSVGQLITVNKLNSVTIYPGQKLQVSGYPEPTEIPVTWIVDKGDTLYGIAKRNNTTVSEIKEMNDLTSDIIKVGQKLQIQQNSAITKK